MYHSHNIMEVDESIKINFLLAYSGTIQSQQTIKNMVKKNIYESSVQREFSLLPLGADYMYVMPKNSLESHLKTLIQDIYKKRRSVYEYINSEVKISISNEIILNNILSKKFNEIENQESGIEKNDFLGRRFDCIIIDEKNPGTLCYGWSLELPSKKIKISWDKRDNEGKNYTFKEGDIVTFEADKGYNDNIIIAKKWKSHKEDILQTKIPSSEGHLNIDIFVEKIKKAKYGLLENNDQLEELLQNGDLCSEVVTKNEIWTKLFGRGESHSFLKKNVEGVNLIFTKDEGEKELISKESSEQIKSALYDISCRKAKSDLNNKGRWLIIADERFLPESKTTAILYTVISPDVNLEDLKPTSAFFHSVNRKEFAKETIQISDLISSQPNIYNFSFEYPNTPYGTSSAKKTSEGIFTTFPIILEIIRKYNHKEGVSVQLICDQANPKRFADGDSVFEMLEYEATELYRNKRYGSFKKVGKWCPLKGKPNQHPFQGYPDIVGRAIKLEPMDKISIKYISSIKRYKVEFKLLKYLNKSIGKSDHLEFFKYIIECPYPDFVEFCRLNGVLSKLIIEALENILSDDNTQMQLFDIIRDNSEKSTSQHIIQAIFSHLQKLEEGIECISNNIQFQFEWLMNRLDLAIKKDNIVEMEYYENMLKNLKQEEGYYKISKDRIDTMEILFLLKRQNCFDFFQISLASVIKLRENLVGQHPSRSGLNHLGTMNLSLALKGESNKEIEDFLLEYSDERGKLRRYTNKLEIKSENSEGKIEYLYNILHNSEIRCDLNSAYFVAACLKCIALSDFNNSNSKFREFAQDFVTNCPLFLSKFHPNQRVAYWFIKAFFNIFPDGNNEQNKIKVDVCAEFLLNIKEIERKEEKWYNAKGVILACELIDLAHNHGNRLEKYVGQEDNFIQYLEDVVNHERTSESTKKWVTNHYPNAEDWLRPLNYNYR